MFAECFYALIHGDNEDEEDYRKAQAALVVVAGVAEDIRAIRKAWQ